MSQSRSVQPVSATSLPLPSGAARERTATIATDTLELVLAELQRISMILAAMADNYVTDEDLTVRD